MICLSIKRFLVIFFLHPSKGQVEPSHLFRGGATAGSSVEEVSDGTVAEWHVFSRNALLSHFHDHGVKKSSKF